MSAKDWTTTFREIYDQAVERYRAGGRRPEDLFDHEGREFLAGMGCAPQEIFDFVEDWCEDEEPGFETVRDITAVRREYFLQEQNGVPSRQRVSASDLPPKHAELHGLAWLPRIIEKARAKLKGEMPPELMFGCGGDRPFLRRVNIRPAEFLRTVWNAGDDNESIASFVKQRAGRT